MAVVSKNQKRMMPLNLHPVPTNSAQCGFKIQHDVQMSSKVGP